MSHLDVTMRNAAQYLQECVGEFAEDALGTMSFPFGSTRVFVSGTEDTTGATFLHLRAHVAHGVPITEALYRWIVDESDGLLFGRIALGYEPDRPDLAELNLRHTLLGDFLDIEEIRAAVVFLATRADLLDDAVVSRFGGRRYSDPDV